MDTSSPLCSGTSGLKNHVKVTQLTTTVAENFLWAGAATFDLIKRMCRTVSCEPKLRFSACFFQLDNGHCTPWQCRVCCLVSGCDLNAIIGLQLCCLHCCDPCGSCLRFDSYKPLTLRLLCGYCSLNGEAILTCSNRCCCLFHGVDLNLFSFQLCCWQCGLVPTEQHETIPESSKFIRFLRSESEHFALGGGGFYAGDVR
eukprot:g77236.t1